MKKVTTNITFGQVLFILLTVIFASAMFFYLGAKFGRQVLNIAGSTADDSQPLLPDEKVSEEIKKILAEEPPHFTFHDVLDENTSDIKTRSPEPSKTDSVKTTPVTKTIPPKMVVEKKKQNEEDLLQVKTAPTEIAKKETTVLLDDPVAMSVPQKQYRLQVGSFSDKKKAQTSQAIWQARGYSVSLVSSEIPGKGTWFKLYLGGFKDLNDVTAVQQKIMKQYKQSAMILE